jgi:hypothetical protein
MLLNTKNLFFKSYTESESQKKSENSSLAQKLTDNFQHSRLSAQWVMEDGKLVCKWFTT